MNLNILALAWRNIRTRRARSWLTILGILIGVTAIVALISIGSGVESAVLRQFEDVGLDVVLLVPREETSWALSDDERGEYGTGILEEEALDVASLPMETLEDGDSLSGTSPDQSGLDLSRLHQDVADVTEIGLVMTRVFSLETASLAGFVRVMSPSWELMERFPGLLGGFEIHEGRDLDPRNENEVILGARVAAEIGAEIGGTLTLDGHGFTIVGILAPSSETTASVGDSLVSGEGAEAFKSLASTDDAVFVPYEHARRLWRGVAMSAIVATRIRTGVSVTDTIERIDDAVQRQGIRMTPVSTQALADNVQRTLGMVKIVLASIAAISLLVGAVGMMNTMYTSVLERTREIGILKAVGAKNRQVRRLFMVDSGLMGLAGGLLGLGLGVGASFLGTRILGRAIGVTTFSPSFSPGLLIGVVVLSFILGALAGVWPAWHAAQLDPVRALASD